MQPNCRLIEDEYRARLPPAHIVRELQTLRLAAREPRRRLTERQISKPEIVQDLKPPLHRFQITANLQCLVNAQGHQRGERTRLLLLVRHTKNLASFLAVSRATAVGAVDRDVGQELNIEAD